MNGQFTQEILSGLSRAVRIKNGLAVVLISLCVSGIGTGIGQALGSEALTTTTLASGADRHSIMAGAGGHNMTLASTPSPAMADPCLPLLNQIRQPSIPAIDRTRRSAGHQQEIVPAVAVGFVLGLRHAPGPTETLKDDINRRSSALSGANDNGHALAVANYRRCRSELALRSPGQG